MNVLAEAHRVLHGARFQSPADRIEVAERVSRLALGSSLPVSGPEVCHTPAIYRRPDGSSRLRPESRALYTTQALVDAEARLLAAGRCREAPAVSMATVARTCQGRLPGRAYGLSTDQALAVEKVATSGRALDVLVGPSGTGKSTTMAGLRAVWEAEHGPGSVLGPGPDGGGGRGAGGRARDRHREHGQVAHRTETGARAHRPAGPAGGPGWPTVPCPFPPKGSWATPWLPWTRPSRPAACTPASS